MQESDSHPYYSTRIKRRHLSLTEFYKKLQSLYLFFREKDYFKEMAGITSNSLPETIQLEAVLDLGFQVFPITKWIPQDITEEHIFDTIEFLYKKTLNQDN